MRVLNTAHSPLRTHDALLTRGYREIVANGFPTDSGLVGWFRADNVTRDGNGDVIRMDNKKGGLGAIEAPLEPANYISDGYNSKPLVQCDSANDKFLSLDNLLTAVPWSAVIATDAADNKILSYGGVKISCNSGTATVKILDSEFTFDADFTVFGVFILVVKSGNLNVWYNDTHQIVDKSVSADFNRVYFGGAPWSDAPVVNFAEFRFFRRDLSNSEVTNEHNSVTSFWGA